MSSIFIVVIAIIGIAVVLLGLGWLGFQVDSDSFPPHPEKTKDAGTIELPSNLPETVMRYYKAAVGSHVPEVKSTVVWGKAKLRIMEYGCRFASKLTIYPYIYFSATWRLHGLAERFSKSMILTLMKWEFSK